MFNRTTAAVILAVAIGATAPGAAAAPNTGAGTGSDSAYCKSLRDRAQRFNDIAHDQRQPRAVRDFYRNRATVVLDAARRAGCGWATLQAAGAPAAGGSERAGAGPAARTSRTTATRRSFTTVEKRRRAKRVVRRGDVTVKGGTTVVTTRISATGTGDPKLDSYCNAVADLITDAEEQGNHQAGIHNSGEAQEWWDLAEHMIDVSTGNGCRFQA